MTHIEYAFGLLVGEIVWLSKLSNWTESRVEYEIGSEDDKNEYKRLLKKWHNIVQEKNDTNVAKPEWNAYRSFAKSLNVKYLPHKIEYHTWIYFYPINKAAFYDGIKTFLWGTDECNYDFKESDIEITPFDDKGTFNLKITFTNSDLPNSEQEIAEGGN